MAPSWKLDDISREDVEAMCQQAGMTDGTFAVRKYLREGAAAGSYALCVVYKGRCTHHGVHPDENGIYSVNGKQFGEYRSVEEVIAHLSNPSILSGSPKWPVVLNNPVGSPEWLRDPMSNEAAAQLITNHSSKDGTFLVRHRGSNYPDQYIISVIYKGRPTHHLVSKDESGTIVIQEKARNGYTSIAHLVVALGSAQPWWPVALKNPVIASRSPGNLNSSAAQMPTNWLHPQMSNEEAKGLLMQHVDPSGDPLAGTFLVRHYGEGKYALSVTYKGRATHHSVSPGDPYTVNGKPFGNASTLEGLIGALAVPGVPGWPVPLQIPVLYDGPSAAEAEALATAAAEAEQERLRIEAEQIEAENIRLQAQKEAAAAEAERQKLAVEREKAAAAKAEQERVAAQRAAEEARAAEAARVAAVAAEEAEAKRIQAEKERLIATEQAEREKAAVAAAAESLQSNDVAGAAQPEIEIKKRSDLASGAATVVRTGEQIVRAQLGGTPEKVKELTPDELRKRGSISQALSSLSAKATTYLGPIDENLSPRTSVYEIASANDAKSIIGSGSGSLNSTARAPAIDIDPYLRVFEILHTKVGNEDADLSLEELERGMDLLREELPQLFVVLEDKLEVGDGQLTAKQVMQFFNPNGDSITVWEFVQAAKKIVQSYRPVHDNIKEASTMSPTHKLTLREIDPSSIDFNKPAYLPTIPKVSAVPEPDPMWLHVTMTRDEAEEMMRTFEAEEGDFLVRTRNVEKHDYVLVVIFKGRITHHSLKMSDNREAFEINKNPFPATSLNEIVKKLSSEVEGWPVVLQRGIGHFGPIDDIVLEIDRQNEVRKAQLASENERVLARQRNFRRQISDDEKKSTDSIRRKTSAVTTAVDTQLSRAQDVAAKAYAQVQLVRKLMDAALKSIAGVSAVEHDLNSPSYMWHSLSAWESKHKLQDQPDGTFLVRRHPESDSIVLLDVVFQKRVATHLIELSSNGISLNGERFDRCLTIDDLIFRLHSPLQGWPVQLQEPVRDPRKCKPRIPGFSSGEDPDEPSYVWPADSLSRREAEELLRGCRDGTFVVREDDQSPRSYLLGIMHNGLLSQHAVQSRGPAAPFTVNGRPMGGKFKIDDVIEYLRVRRSDWPVRLTTAIRSTDMEDAPEPPGIDETIISEMQSQATDLQSQLIERIRLHELATSRVEAIANLEPNEEYEPPSNIAADLYNLDIECARLTVTSLEAALQEKEDALSEIRHYDAIGADLPGGLIEQEPSNPSYLWSSLTKDDAGNLLAGIPDGGYLVFGSEANRILAVVFQNDVTYHSLSQGAQGHILVNGRPMGGKSTVDGLVRFLSDSRNTAKTTWPVTLTNPVRNPEQPRPESESLRLAAADVARVESDLDDARADLFALTAGVAVKGSTTRAIDGQADPRIIVPDKIRRLIKQLEEKVGKSFTRVCRSSLPILTDEHADILLQVVQTRAAEMSSLKINSLDVDSALPSVCAELFELGLTAQRARSARKLLADLQPFTDTAKHSTLQEKAKGSIANSIEGLLQLLDISRSDLKDLINERDAAVEQPNTSMSVLEDFKRKLVVVKKYIESKTAEISELQRISESECLSTFYVTAKTNMNVALQRILALVQQRRSSRTSPLLSEGIECGIGFVPIPSLPSDAVASQLFSQNGITDTEKINEVVNEFARILAIRYSEQLELLTVFEATRMGLWVLKPILGTLIYPPKDTFEVVVPALALREIRLKEVESISAPHRIAAAPLSSGLRIGDSVIALNGKDTRQMPLLSVQKVLAGLKSSTNPVPARFSISRSVDVNVPIGPVDLSKRIALFFVRSVDAWDDQFEAEVFDDEGSSWRVQLEAMHTCAFNAALRSDLLGGSIWLDTKHGQVRPADLFRKSGLAFLSKPNMMQYFSTSETNVEVFGYRRNVESVPELYVTLEEQTRELGWESAFCATHRHDEEPPMSLFHQMERDSPTLIGSKSPSASIRSLRASRQSSIDSTASRMEVWSPVGGQLVEDLEALARAKTEEAEALRLQMLQMQEQMTMMQAQNARLNQRNAVPRQQQTVQFRSSLHQTSRA